MKEIYNYVEAVLKEDPRARDSDIWLVLEVLRKMGFTIFIDYTKMADMPSFETITRIRREIQNTEGRLEASEFVKTQRKVNQQEHAYKFSSKSRADTMPNSQYSP